MTLEETTLEEGPIEPEIPRISRRAFLYAGLGAAATLCLGACSSDRSERTTADPRSDRNSPAPEPSLQPTPACADGDDPTPSQTEGPYFKPSSPERSNLLEGASGGTQLTLVGSVVDTACRPVARALLDFWQADGDGNYDNEGYRLRGHLFCDEGGQFRLETVVPGNYAGRTRHIHVKAQPPGGDVLTTQLYFPGEPGNRSDRLFRQECVMDVKEVVGGKAASFRFVLRS